MSETISSPAYWARRLRIAQQKGHLYQAVYMCNLQYWELVEAKHREILARVIAPGDSILDAGCGYGRLITLLPPEWHGTYLGVDLSPEFIHHARSVHPSHSFAVGKLADYPLTLPPKSFDWAVMVSIRGMIKRHHGEVHWKDIETGLRHVAHRLLYLEYDDKEEGSIE